MFDLMGQTTRTCDGVSRRGFLRVGGLAFGGLTVADWMQARAEGKVTGNRPRKSVIQIWLAGGPSHLDMYDLKPQAPAEYRGEFRPIPTNVPGFQISEHLSRQAKLMDKMSVVRSVYHTNAGHGMGSQWMLTGWQPTIEVNTNIFPACGSVVSQLYGANDRDLPAYVNLPRALGLGKAAYLGASHNPFSPEDDPNREGFQVRNLKLPGKVDAGRLDNRRQLLGKLDTIRRDLDAAGDLHALDSFYAQGLEMVTNDKAMRAFDINAEKPTLRDNYGRNDLGQSCLLARRLVEAGVSYVTIQAGGGWDTHGDNFKQLKDKLLPNYDQALSALVQDLADRNLADEVLVMAFGEFGRTPRINGNAGRDHWPGAMSVLLSGGGLKMGQVIGETDSKAEAPISKPYTPGCLLSTMYYVLHLDYRHVFYDQARRPMPVLAEGKPIPELI
jgi:uncharacterized protein (DUF1501 family)